ncbi:hypothetical protein C7974DRAFT_156084 [Boeremia exigua]|uniref:uncharacterized protein n=1 Tax=Boeremia exigua TaxID=749465 RepID=UPI001E8C9E7F|nr:uncharacterized protein C7974DRAFT_156084 [Boeremia exigua]KAH6638199.1 hypothetical protein C7974DRAFT_156084 [Boeremia exigua]
MIETPAKRLRILRSIEVDETNPDYIEAKQKQQQKFKGRLERMFEKYENMHESMTDEVDLNTGKIVVDRGHIRRMQRQLTRNRPTMVDSFLGAAIEDDTASEDEDGQGESEDELAPTQTRKRKRDSVEDSETAQTPAQQNMNLVATPQAVPTAFIQRNSSHIPNTPNPAANLLESIQFPQTPLGQQAQAAFVASLNQTIVQAVQQVVAPLFTILQNTPNGQAVQPQLPATSLPLPSTDGVKPAADPKWYFPPILAIKKTPQTEHPRSSPPVVTEAPLASTNEDHVSLPPGTRRRSPKVHIRMRSGPMRRDQISQTLETTVERPHSSHSLPALRSDIDVPLDAHLVDKTSARKAKTVRLTRKYHFTEEDDAYIRERRVLHNMSFKDIKASKTKWSDWPTTALSNRWRTRLKDESHQNQTKSKTRSVAQNPLPTSEEHEEHYFSSMEIPETSSAEHRLPTPNSLEQESHSSERIVLPSSSHFDDDELELLSLAGADISDSPSAHFFDDEGNMYPAPDEPLPSIEGADFRNEDELQLEMLKTEDSPTPEPPQCKTLPSTIPETQESGVVVSSTSQNRMVIEKPKTRPEATYRASSKSSDDLDLIGTSDEPATPHIRIKRESLTPQATKFLCSSPVFKTPRPAPQSSGLLAKSTGKLNRRAFLNDVKQGWTKSKGKTSSSQKRRSLNLAPTIVGTRRVGVKASDSEDELAV